MNDHAEHNHDHGEHGHSHDHGHGHANDQGLKGALRYLRFAPQMWRSEINDAVLAIVAAKPSEHVLDIGAGMGAGTVVGARSGATVIAVEPTPFLRRVLTARTFLQRNRDRINVVDGAAEKLPLPDASVDAAWSVNAMHHWVDQKQAASELARVVKPGGRVILVDEDFLDPAHPEFEKFEGRHAPSNEHSSSDNTEHDDAGHHHGFTMVDAEQMGGLLTSTGFAEVTAEKRDIAGRPSITVIGAR